MRILWVFAVLLALSFADDKVFCTSSCEQKYEDVQEKSVCTEGCSFRRSLSQGFFAFVACHRSCDSRFNTTDAGPCHFACGLPMTNMLVMTVKYNNDRKPMVEMVQHDGFSDSSLEDFENLTPGKLFKAFGLEQSPYFETDIDDEFQRMRDRFSQMTANLQRLDDSSDSGPEEDSASGENTQIRRVFGHEREAQTGVQVGNSNPDGTRILEVNRVGESSKSDETEEQHNRMEGKARWKYAYGLSPNWRDRSRSLFYLQLAFLALCILAVVLSVMLLVRVIRLRRDRYSRIQCPSTTATTAGSQASPLPPKKIPLELDGFGEPSGTPPPAYDQLSMGSVHKKVEKDV